MYSVIFFYLFFIIQLLLDISCRAFDEQHRKNKKVAEHKIYAVYTILYNYRQNDPCNARLAVYPSEL